jgi:hypothetical protein
MGLTRKDLSATVLTALVVATYAATHQGWNVPLVGSSHRWAAAAIMVLGMTACGRGSPDKSTFSAILGVFGGAALVLGVLALVTGSLTPLSLLVADTVLLWAVATLRHATQHVPRHAAPI